MSNIDLTILFALEDTPAVEIFFPQWLQNSEFSAIAPPHLGQIMMDTPSYFFSECYSPRAAEPDASFTAFAAAVIATGAVISILTSQARQKCDKKVKKPKIVEKYSHEK